MDRGIDRRRNGQRHRQKEKWTEIKTEGRMDRDIDIRTIEQTDG
jgi:hypothetical protein